MGRASGINAALALTTFTPPRDFSGRALLTLEARDASQVAASPVQPYPSGSASVYLYFDWEKCSPA